MEKTKLTLRIDQAVIALAKDYAKQHNTSVSQLVTRYLRTLDSPAETPRSPILDELTGILPADVAVDEYHAFLEQKYE